MEIQVTHEQGSVPVSVLHVTGEVNVNSYEQLQTAAREQFEGGAHDMVIDLANVTYISSAGIRAITSIFRMLRGQSAAESPAAMQKGLREGTFKSPHLRLAAPQPNVAEVLKLAGVDMFLDIHPNVAAALAAF